MISDLSLFWNNLEGKDTIVKPPSQITCPSPYTEIRIADIKKVIKENMPRLFHFCGKIKDYFGIAFLLSRKPVSKKIKQEPLS